MKRDSNVMQVSKCVQVIYIVLFVHVQTLFCIEVHVRTGKNLTAILVPMVSGYKYNEIGTFMGHKKYHNTPAEPLTFGLTAGISLHAVTTGYQLQQPFEHGYAYLSGHIQPNVVVAIPTARPLHDFSAFDFSRAFQQAQVNCISSTVCTTLNYVLLLIRMFSRCADRPGNYNEQHSSITKLDMS